MLSTSVVTMMEWLAGPILEFCECLIVSSDCKIGRLQACGANTCQRRHRNTPAVKREGEGEGAGHVLGTPDSPGTSISTWW